MSLCCAYTGLAIFCMYISSLRTVFLKWTCDSVSVVMDINGVNDVEIVSVNYTTVVTVTIDTILITRDWKLRSRTQYNAYIPNKRSS